MPGGKTKLFVGGPREGDFGKGWGFIAALPPFTLLFGLKNWLELGFATLLGEIWFGGITVGLLGIFEFGTQK